MTPIDLQFLYKKKDTVVHIILYLQKIIMGLFQQNVSPLQIDMVNQEIFIFFNISSRFLPNHALYICSKARFVLQTDVLRTLCNVCPCNYPAYFTAISTLTLFTVRHYWHHPGQGQGRLFMCLRLRLVGNSELSNFLIGCSIYG